MTDREKKQREILEILVSRETNRRYDESEEVLGLSEQQSYAQALSELAKLDTMPTSKEVEDAMVILKTMEQSFDKEHYPIQYKAFKTLIQAVKPKEEAGCEEIAKHIQEKTTITGVENSDYKGNFIGMCIGIKLNKEIKSVQDLTKSLLTKYSIRRREDEERMDKKRYIKKETI